jgi:uroporphyrin-III C-methyltransferase/precorrin-2 dehydrogenase/sirohydrochlorin ferrochelatase
MRNFPAFLDLAGRTALLIGAGEVIGRTAEPLRRAGATLRQAPRFDPALLEGVAVAIGADAPEEDLRALSMEAQRRGIPVNIVDRGELCSFVMPAVAGCDPVTAALAAGGSAPMPPGMVCLVGAGPGAAELLTLRALRLLGEADVIVHDRLVSDEVLDLAHGDAERIFAGKSRANHCLPQAEINALLVHLARQGRRVVRLKGGDPFVFGRGGEEAAALAEAGIPYQVVPGVTAALACGADAGIPLTHRDAAQMLTLVTGHTREGRLDLDVTALARPNQTLAIYMGLSNLPDLVRQLTSAGLDASHPAAIVEGGGTVASRRLDGTLGSLPELARAVRTAQPALIIIGEVVRLAPPVAPAAALSMRYAAEPPIMQARHTQHAEPGIEDRVGDDPVGRETGLATLSDF